MKIEVTFEQTEAIIVKELKFHIKYLENGGDPYEAPKSAAATLASLYEVLAYFSSPDEYEDFVAKRREKNIKKVGRGN